MALVYALVARGNNILAEFTDSSGNFTTVTQSILDKVPDKDAKCTYVYDRLVVALSRHEYNILFSFFLQVLVPLHPRRWNSVLVHGRRGIW